MLEEVRKHRANAVGVLPIGNLNVHSAKWLRHSSGETVEANRLRAVCEELGLKQRVTAPTRKDISGSDYLLDLVLAEFDVDTIVGGKIRDHGYVLTKMNIQVPEKVILNREAWDFAKAGWVRLKEVLRDHHWSALYGMGAQEAAAAVTETTLHFAKQCIGKKVVK